MGWLIGLSIALSAVSTGLQVWGAHQQGIAERRQLNKEAGREKERLEHLEGQYRDQREDIQRESEFTDSSILTAAAASGIQGPMADATRGFSLEEYNRAIGRLDEELGMAQKSSAWTLEDISAGIEQSRWNQGFSVASSILGGAADITGKAYQAGLQSGQQGIQAKGFDKRSPEVLDLYRSGYMTNQQLKFYNRQTYRGGLR